jgi:hypothetical protein
MRHKIALVIGLIITPWVASAQTTITAGMFTFDFSLDTSANFFSSTGSGTARNTLALAGTFVSNIISGTTQLSAIDPTAASKSWDATFNDPGTLNSASTHNLTVASGTFYVYAGGSSSLDFTTLAETTRGGFSGATANTSWLNTLNYRNSGSTSSYYMPWGGSMSFNSGSNWYYDNNTSFTTGEIGGSQNDFFGVAVHELFHLLGFGTGTTWTNLVNSGNFTGANALAAYNAYYSLSATGVPLDLDGAHWTETMRSVSLATGASNSETMMDPTLSIGTRKYPTTLDAMAIKDLGYAVNTSAIPEPADTAVIGACAAFAVGLLLRRTRAGK